MKTNQQIEISDRALAQLDKLIDWQHETWKVLGQACKAGLIESYDSYSISKLIKALERFSSKPIRGMTNTEVKKLFLDR